MEFRSTTNEFESRRALSDSTSSLNSSDGIIHDRVQGLANSVYGEFEQMIKKYDEDVVKSLMPLVVGILEALEQALKEKYDQSIDSELLKDDNEQLLVQYEKERTAKREAEQRCLVLEDALDEEKKSSEVKTEQFESMIRLMELKNKNLTDHVSRMEEKETELKTDQEKLRSRYTDLFKTHMDYVERMKHQSVRDRGSDSFASPSSRPGSLKAKKIRDSTSSSVSPRLRSPVLDKAPEKPTPVRSAPSPSGLEALSAQHSAAVQDYVKRTDSVSIPGSQTLDVATHEPAASPPTPPCTPLEAPQTTVLSSVSCLHDVSSTSTADKKTISPTNSSSEIHTPVNPIISPTLPDDMISTPSLSRTQASRTQPNRLCDSISHTLSPALADKQRQSLSFAEVEMEFDDRDFEAGGEWSDVSKGVADTTVNSVDFEQKIAEVNRANSAIRGSPEDFSLFSELAEQDRDALGDMYLGPDLAGMSNEVDNLILENNELIATKNALNIVKDDLIAQVDELQSEVESSRGEVESLKATRTRLRERITELEDELRKKKEEMDEMREKLSKAKEEDEDGDTPTAQRRRFTRAEMSRVLSERNQYKERLMELEDAIRRQELLRAQREHPELAAAADVTPTTPVNQPQKRAKPSGVWGFFTSLVSTEPTSPSSPESGKNSGSTTVV